MRGGVLSDFLRSECKSLNLLSRIQIAGCCGCKWGFLGFEVPLFLGDHNVTFVGCGCFEKSRLLTPSPPITPYVEDL